MNKDKKSCYTMNAVQPTSLYLEAVAIISNALDNNDSQIEKLKQLATDYDPVEKLKQLTTDYELEQELLCAQMLALETQFLEQEEDSSSTNVPSVVFSARKK